MTDLTDVELVRTIKRAWQGMNFDAGEVAALLVEAGRRHCWPSEFPTFRAWVTGPSPQGLDRDPDVLLGVLHRGHLPKIEWALIELLKAPHGGPRHAIATKSDNVTLARQGNSAPYALLRLARERKDLHQQVLVGKLSAHAAMVEAGFRPRMLSVPDDPAKALAILIKRYGLATMAKLIADLRDGKDGV